MSTDLALMAATDLLDAYRRKTLSPVEVTKAVFDRIAAVDGGLNAMVLLIEEEALAAARGSEARWQKGAPQGLVDGVPTTIKDLSLMKGHPTRRGSLTVDPDQAWEEDSAATARLREEGAVLIGKTTTPEFGWKGVTDSPLTGITRNPWDPNKTCGGSSGGAAVAAAAGMGALHLGGDGGGSIRIPCGFTGVFGLKPTAGRVPYYPPSPLWGMSHNGPITRTVADAALMLEVIAKRDRRDWLAIPLEPDDYRRRLEDGVAGLRIAYSPDLGYAEVAAPVAEAVRNAVAVLEERGAAVEAIDGIFPNPRAAFEILFGMGQAKLYRRLDEGQRERLDPGFAAWAREAERIDLFTYLDAEAERYPMGQALDRLFGRYDLLITPQLPLTAFDAGLEYPPDRGMRRWLDWSPFTYPFNMTGHPAAAVPCGFDDAGLPIAMQIIGDRLADALVLLASRAFEQVRPFPLPPVASYPG